MYPVGANENFFHLVKLESSTFFAVAAIGKQYLIAGMGEVQPGLLRSRLHLLSDYFTQMLEQVKGT
jgi:hypothetical protein